MNKGHQTVRNTYVIRFRSGWARAWRKTLAFDSLPKAQDVRDEISRMGYETELWRSDFLAEHEDRHENADRC